MRRVGETVGHTRGRVQADVPRPRVRHQRGDVLPERFRVRDRQRRCHVPPLRHTRRPGAGDVQPRQHHLRHHERRLQQERPSAFGRIRRLQL